DTRKSVVVKVIHEHLAANPALRERFDREAELMARLNHPHAVNLLATATDDRLGPFLVMEYVNGVPLDKLLARPPRFGPARLPRLVGQLCDVLQAAHDQGVVHCDLKPANLMVVDFETPQEKLKLMDFGLARLKDQPAEIAAPGEAPAFAVGTPGY